MDDNAGARIIPFPARPARPEVPSQPPQQDSAAERLQRAVALLEKAVAAQREAVGQWRGALHGLHGTVETLRGSLVAYDRQLGTLRDRVDTVNRSARALESWADAALAAPQAAQPK